MATRRKTNTIKTIKAWKEFLSVEINLNTFGDVEEKDEDGNEIEDNDFWFLSQENFNNEMEFLFETLSVMPYPVVFENIKQNGETTLNVFEDANDIMRVFKRTYARDLMARVEKGRIELPVYDLGGGIVLPQVLELKVTKK